jgi:hypothetical protein
VAIGIDKIHFDAFEKILTSSGCLEMTSINSFQRGLGCVSKSLKNFVWKKFHSSNNINNADDSLLVRKKKKLDSRLAENNLNNFKYVL